MTALGDARRVADAEAEQETLGIGTGQRLRAVRRRHRVARVDVRDSARDDDPARPGKQRRCVRGRLSRADALSEPECPVAEPLEFSCRFPLLARCSQREAPEPDSDSPDLH
jgi:hypothetical protein